MDIATLIGVIAGFGLVIGSIAIGGPISGFINVPGLLIVVGGTFASTLIALRLATAMNAIKVAANAVFDRTPSADETSATILKLAAKVRKEDLLALESVKVSDPFVKKAVRLAVDGIPLATIRSTLNSELASLQRRHETGHQVFRFMGKTAPAMGMVGTLIGLVQMLQALDNPSSIGPAMAVALLTTLYGAVLAFLVFNPIADKLASKTEIETTHMRVVIEGIESVVNGENAAIAKEKLEAFLAPAERRVARRKSEHHGARSQQTRRR